MRVHAFCTAMGPGGNTIEFEDEEEEDLLTNKDKDIFRRGLRVKRERERERERKTET